VNKWHHPQKVPIREFNVEEKINPGAADYSPKLPDTTRKLDLSKRSDRKYFESLHNLSPSEYTIYDKQLKNIETPEFRVEKTWRTLSRKFERWNNYCSSRMVV
jgi:hypothetical protein